MTFRLVCPHCHCTISDHGLWEVIDTLVEIYGSLDKVIETYKVLQMPGANP